jgi:hypothetical protein
LHVFANVNLCLFMLMNLNGVGKQSIQKITQNVESTFRKESLLTPALVESASNEFARRFRAAMKQQSK